MTRRGRIAVVTCTLSAVGAVVGALVGELVSSFFISLVDVHLTILDPFALGFPACVGALLGAILTPTAGWMLLRRISLGRAFLGLSGGTTIGGVIGSLFVPIWGSTLIGTTFGAVFGFVAAALLLRASSITREDIAKPAGRVI
jgi:uncharacterized membrane protein YfcA